ncbi:MAG: hypothetical protein PVF65_08950 [Sphingomonadales bacterium]|jgi:hypothetical protein
MIRHFTALLMTGALLTSSAFAQKDDEDDPRLARLVSSALPEMPAIGLIQIDSLCQDDDAQFIETKLISWLRDQGYKVETLAPYTLRLELAPCEDVGLLPGRGGVEEAYRGTSRLEEFQRATPIWRVPLGKGSTGKQTVSAKLLLYKSGAQPVWSAHIRGQAGAFGVRSYKARLLEELLNVFGKNTDEKILIEK